MKKLVILAALLVGAPVLAADDKPAPAAPMPAGQTAEEMLQEYNSIKPPVLDRTRQQDQEYIQSYIKEYRAAQLKRADLAKEFAQRFPDNAETPKLLLQRWMSIGGSSPESFKTIVDESNAFLEKHPDSADALFANALAHLYMGPGELDNASKAIDRFVTAAPKDQRGAQLLMTLADREKDQSKAASARKRLMELYPDSPAAQMAKGAQRQSEGLGKPFELSFTDAISGKQISMNDLKGKVVVIDFWATWCGPCVAEMPHMKEIYAKFHDKGVEFIGVSLDQPEANGGLTALKKFVQEHQIAWPQYYQGKGWQSEFSSGWGIQAIPTMFLVDQSGKLVSVKARGELENLIPKLLEEGKGAAPATEEKK